MEYSCEKCGYNTNNKNSYNIHLNSQKHNGKVNKTDNKAEYMSTYMKQYNKQFDKYVCCKVCNKTVKQYTYYSHCKSITHQLASRLLNTTTNTELKL